jgi:integrase
VYRRTNEDGSSYVAQVRVKGFKPASETFAAKDFASDLEAIAAAKAWRESYTKKLREERAKRPLRADVSTLTLGQLVSEYLEDPETEKLATVEERARQLAWWTERHGSERAMEFVNAQLLRTARAELLESFGPATTNRYLAAVRKAINFGREAELLPGVVWPPGLMLTEPKHRERYLDDPELERVLAAARKDSAVMYAAVMFAIGVGCRQSEQLRVRWRDIDEQTSTVAITVTKTNTSRRAHLPSALVETLKSLRSGKVKPLPSAFVFAEGGEAIPAHTLINRWELIRKAAKVPDVRWHDLRHACASFLIQNGSSLAEVSAQLGHKSVATSARYAHLVPGMKPTGADALNAKLKG